MLFNVNRDDYEKYSKMYPDKYKNRLNEIDTQIRKLENERYAIRAVERTIDDISVLKKNLAILAKCFIGKWVFIERAHFMGNNDTVAFGKSLYLERGNSWNPEETDYKRVDVIDKDGKVIDDPCAFLGAWQLVFEGIIYAPSYSKFPMTVNREVWDLDMIKSIVDEISGPWNKSTDIDQIILKHKDDKENCSKLLKEYHDNTAERLASFADNAIDAYNYLLDNVGSVDIDLKRIARILPTC